MEAPRRSRRLAINRRKNKSLAEEPSQTSIADLPEAMLLHILSFLPSLDAIRISVVAPPWRNLWHSLPKLDLDMHYFQKQIVPGKSNRLGRVLFAEFVSHALRRLNRCSTVQKFKLRFFYRNYGHIEAYVDSWIHTLLTFLRPVEIDWDFADHGKIWSFVRDDDEEDDDLFAPYEFYLYDFVGSSIEVLKLTNCRLSFPRNNMAVHSIKKVHLDCFRGRVDDIERLMASCVNLETFVLELCGNASELNIVSASLKHLTLDVIEPVDMNYVEIGTPRLESIEIHEFSRGIVYHLKHVSSLIEATVGINTCYNFWSWSWWDFACWANVLSFFTGVERLTIHNIPQDEYDLGSKHPPIQCSTEREIQELKGVKVFSEIYAFHNLIYLTLKTGYLKEDILSLKVLLNKCPLLETMVLVWDNFARHRESITNQERQKKKETIDDGLVGLQIPRLRVVKMEGYLGTKNELYVVEQLKKHGVVLERIVAFPVKKVKVGEKKILLPPFLL